MENNSHAEVNPLEIQNILTLRYSPIENSQIKKADWTDFIEKNVVQPEITLETLLKNNIKNSLSKVKKITMALSGGVDSMVILSLLKETLQENTITAVTVTFSQSEDESKSAKNISEYFGIDHKIIHVENFLRELPLAISILKKPFYDSMNWFYLVKNTSAYSDAIVSGDGGDEIFGGYTFRYSKFLELIDSNSGILEKIRCYLDCHERDWVPDQQDIFGKKCTFSWEQIYQILQPYFDNKLSPLDQVFLADFNGKLLYNWIPNYYKYHKHFGVNSITPLLSQDIIEFGRHLPMNQKYNSRDNLGKLILRHILKKKNISYLESPNKQGFSVNTNSLWKLYGKEICEQYLSDSRIAKNGWVNQNWIDKNFVKANNENNIRYINKYLSLLGFEIWYRLFITKEMKSNEKL